MNGAPELLEAMQFVLEDEGYRVTSLEEALTDMRTLAYRHPDLVILDWLFQGGARGLQVVQAIRLRPAFKDLPIIVCSAAIREMREMADYFEAQHVTVLFKPFDLDSFLTAVGRALEMGRFPHAESPEG
ncbi:MAG TPA: response regulator [Ktedonobacterales bacterium]|jgi:two-component system alkaline phosphatase synthesis response regulator PhoP|nr:response regulator [Ktedonobacterales bacterium]